MSCLFIDHRDAELSFATGALTIRLPGEAPRNIPAAMLERVCVRGDVRLSARVLTGLADSGVTVLFQTGRTGAQTACVIGRPGADVRRRLWQARRVDDPDFINAWSRSIVRAKLTSQSALLRKAMSERPDIRKPLGDGLNTLRGSRLALSTSSSASLDTIRGYEGAAAAAYFRAYSSLFAPSLGFTHRRRRPPPDPVNAALSLGYTLLYGLAVRASHATGLDPMIGYLHGCSHDRASLACDLMEPWRARIDRMVWGLFRTRTLTAEHFGRESGSDACLLGKAGRRHFYAAWVGQTHRLSRALMRHGYWALRCIESDNNPGPCGASINAPGAGS